MKRENVFCDTQEINKGVNEIIRRWDRCGMTPEDGHILYEFQEKLKPEREYLKTFWTENDGKSIPFGGLAGWCWEKALYDMPTERQKYALERFDGKYGIFHEREDYLNELQRQIFCLYHEWEFTIYGYTAY